MHDYADHQPRLLFPHPAEFSAPPFVLIGHLSRVSSVISCVAKLASNPPSFTPTLQSYLSYRHTRWLLLSRGHAVTNPSGVRCPLAMRSNKIYPVLQVAGHPLKATRGCECILDQGARQSLKIRLSNLRVFRKLLSLWCKPSIVPQ